MKTTIALLLSGTLIFNAAKADADNFGLPNGMSGMVTGALLGSVFGPSKRHRTKNAVIGAFAGLLLGSQQAQANNSPVHARNTALYAPAPARETVVYAPAPARETVVYAPAPEPEVIVTRPNPRYVVVEPTTPRSRTVIVEQPTTIIQYVSRGDGHRHRHWRRHRNRHQNHGYWR